MEKLAWDGHKKVEGLIHLTPHTSPVTIYSPHA